MNPPARLHALLGASRELAGRLLSESEIERLVCFYGLVLKWNPQLHLTTLTGPAEFLERHLVESAFLTQHIAPTANEVWDFGSGLGIPGVPIAILRPDLHVTLVEANRRKAVFLEEVAARLNLGNVKVANVRLESLVPLPPTTSLTARAVDNMQGMLPHLLRLGKDATQILLLGSAELAEPFLSAAQFSVETCLLSGSDARFLVIATRST